ncbi:uncharacterized protein LOC129000214 [Macrosteles quadrilineatus]|uniref:uncharacterized protein LOC129000214 n=1 Tax=Macrosteles quadrilineatus TaxID=74068 RepID=UPI0023E24E38|nr:uncharacterized protein LOC129000214 [Macrosteles quadrilineatus]
MLYLWYELTFTARPPSTTGLGLIELATSQVVLFSDRRRQVVCNMAGDQVNSDCEHCGLTTDVTTNFDEMKTIESLDKLVGTSESAVLNSSPNVTQTALEESVKLSSVNSDFEVSLSNLQPVNNNKPFSTLVIEKKQPTKSSLPQQTTSQITGNTFNSSNPDNRSTAISKPRLRPTRIFSNTNENLSESRGNVPSYADITKLHRPNQNYRPRVRGQSQQDKPIIGTKGMSGSSNLKVVKRKTWIFVSRLSPGVCCDDLKTYLMDSNIQNADCEELPTRYTSYKSFKVGLYPMDAEKVLFDVTKPSTPVTRLLNLLRQHNLYHHNDQPTRYNACLDNVFTNCGSDNLSTSVVPCHFSDHDGLALFAIEGHFPEFLKLSKICPIFKKGDKASPQSYRPISLVPTLAKVVEHVIYNQVRNFFEYHALFNEQQFGFRAGRSTTGAIDAMVRTVFNCFESREAAWATFIDLSKAFDCVDHGILLQKLEYYGIRGASLSLFRTYLADRRQAVCIGNTWSSVLSTNCGVPQGSVLGPLLFLIAINDLPFSLNCEAYLYADDTTILSKGADVTQLVAAVESSLSLTSEWFAANKFLVNEDKTQSMLFSLRPIPQMEETIKNNSNVKILGVIVDPQLTWNSQHVSSGKAAVAGTAVTSSRAVRSVWLTSFTPYILSPIYLYLSCHLCL